MLKKPRKVTHKQFCLSFSARGTTEGPGGSIAYNSIYQKVLAAVSGGEKKELQYSTSADYTVTVTQGAQTEAKMITDEISKCPKTVFVLLGYSKGVSHLKNVMFLLRWFSDMKTHSVLRLWSKHKLSTRRKSPKKKSQLLFYLETLSSDLAPLKTNVVQ
jgi:hypothetical protein